MGATSWNSLSVWRKRTSGENHGGAGIPTAHDYAKVVALSLLALLCVNIDSAFGQFTAELDKVDATDGVQIPPAHIVCVDLLVIPGFGPAWDGTGINAVAYNGARFIHAVDPNSGAITGIAPGAENRFVTFFGEPRPRDSDSRYEYVSAAYIGGRYCGGASPVFTDSELNAFAIELPPSPPGSGWVLRVALDLFDVTDPRFRTDSNSIVIASEQPPDSIVLLETFCSSNAGTNIGGGANSISFDWGIYGIIPEPGTSLLLVVVLAGLRKWGR